MDKRLLFVFNPHAGKGLIRNQLLDIVDNMVKAGYEVTIYPTQKAGDAGRLVAEKADQYDLIVTGGGDGTLDETVNGLITANVRKPIGYIPAGSTNDFANSLGLPKNMVQAAITAVSGNPVPCDMGYFNGKTFVYVAAFGLFTEVSYQTPQELKNLFGHAAYILEGMMHLTDVPAYSMTVEHDGQLLEGDFIYGMVTNSLSVGGFKGLTGEDVKLDDGLFEVTLIRAPKNAIELSEIVLALNSHVDNTIMVESFKTESLIVRPEKEVAWTLDGEFGGNQKELLIRNLHHQVDIMVDPNCIDPAVVETDPGAVEGKSGDFEAADDSETLIETGMEHIIG